MQDTTGNTPICPEADDRVVLSVEETEMVAGGLKKKVGAIRICPKCGAPIPSTDLERHMATHK